MGSFANRYESYLIFFGLLLASLFPAFVAQAATDVAPCTLSIPFQGAISPATVDFFKRSIEDADRQSCGSILIRINTPGGDLMSARELVERILASKIPILCVIAPEGGHAGSAGALIMLGCHVNGALPATNLGAATPIGGNGETIGTDLREKVIQDTVAWAKGLAKLRNRNADFAEKIIRNAQALDANEAARTRAIDTVSADIPVFIKFATGRTVTMEGGRKDVVRTGPLIEKAPDLRTHLLSIVTDPTLAYLIFMASLSLLYFELTHPGSIAPGVAGAIGLLTSFIAFQHLDIWWGGAGLIALGLALLFLEAFVPSFGALGIGGIVALGAGSVLLYDPSSPGGVVGLPIILTTTGLLGSAMFGLAILAFRTRRSRRQAGFHLREGRGVVMKVDAQSSRHGLARVEGEIWNFISDVDVQPGDQLVVISRENLILNVRKLS